MNHKQIKDGITITAVKIKNVPQSPFSQSTKAPDEDASVVLPAVPIEASNAYWVAVYVLSTNNDIKATNATVANAAAISSNMTATANSNSDLPLHAKAVNNKLGESFQIPPKYSAIKVKGKRLYKYAREGRDIDIPKRKINNSFFCNFI